MPDPSPSKPILEERLVSFLTDRLPTHFTRFDAELVFPEAPPLPEIPVEDDPPDPSDPPNPKPLSFWQRLIRWIKHLIHRLFGNHEKPEK